MWFILIIIISHSDKVFEKSEKKALFFNSEKKRYENIYKLIRG